MGTFLRHSVVYVLHVRQATDWLIVFLLYLFCVLGFCVFVYCLFVFRVFLPIWRINVFITSHYRSDDTRSSDAIAGWFAVSDLISGTGPPTVTARHRDTSGAPPRSRVVQHKQIRLMSPPQTFASSLLTRSLVYGRRLTAQEILLSNQHRVQCLMFST